MPPPWLPPRSNVPNASCATGDRDAHEGDTRQVLARAFDLFDEVADLSPFERAAILDHACAGHPALRREVEDLLRADAAPPAFLDDSAAQLAASIFPDLPQSIQKISSLTSTSAPEPPPNEVGKAVGPYRLLRALGYGGMGSVYLAERADGQFAQRVAIKLLYAAPDVAERLKRRLRTERQILAALNHPNIARVFDGGVTEDGRPYLVMEYVNGQPIDVYCDAHGLGVEARLRLFCQVADAVQAAHRRLVVHRDLKPSNILVCADDAGHPQAKLLDFGIAKLLDDGDGPSSILGQASLVKTQTGEHWMTPAYAAPEQVRGRAITTATDVYQLGVVLYQLLTHRHPYNADPNSGPYRMARAVLEQQPSRPSTAVRLAARPPGAAMPDANRLAQRLRGDLDVIVLTALRKEPEQRYPSAEAFVADVRRYLDGRPIEARGATVRYRVGKFLRRHRSAVMAAVAVVLLIVGYAVTATVQARRVGAERDKAEAVSTFLVSLFEEADPELGAGGAVTAQAMLDAGARRLREEGLVEQPAVRTELATVMGRAYRGLGAYERALAIHYRALAEVEALHGPRSLPTADAHNDVGEVLYDLGRLQEAGAHYDTSLTIRRRHLDRDHVDIAQSLNNLALLDLTRARLDDASVLLAEAVVIFARALGPTHWRTANAQSNLGRVRLMQGRLEHAERLFRAALTAHERGGRTTHRGAAIARHSLASVLLRRGHHAEAERLEREALALLRTQVDAQSPLIGYFLLNLGEAQQGQFLYDDAQRTFEQALDRLQNSLPDDHYRQSEPRLALGLLWMAQDEPRQAGPLLREAVRLVETALGADHWRAAEARSALAACLAASGRTAEARPMLEEAVATLEAARGPQAPATVAARARLAALDGS